MTSTELKDPIAARLHAAKWKRIDLAVQVGIAITCIAGSYLIASTSVYARWGYVICLASQPLYFIATVRARQWGMFLCAIFITGAWTQGVLNRF